jgi:NAD+ diphosphatase
MEYKHCPECGDELISKEIGDEGSIPFCNSCEKPYFDVIHPCVIVAVINEFGEVALLKQDFRWITAWALVSAYMKKGETLEETVKREVKEETGLNVKESRYIDSYYASEQDMIMIGFVSFVEKKDFAKSKEILDINWYSQDEALSILREGSIAKNHFKRIQELGLCMKR